MVGGITPLTRNLHLGSAVALTQGTAYNMGGLRYFTRELPKGLCYRQPPVYSRSEDSSDEDGKSASQEPALSDT